MSAGAWAAAGELGQHEEREHSRKPDEFYDVIAVCSPGPRLALFASGARDE